MKSINRFRWVALGAALFLSLHLGLTTLGFGWLAGGKAFATSAVTPMTSIVILAEDGVLRADVRQQFNQTSFNAHHFTARAGQSVTITAESSDFVPTLILLNPQGENIGESRQVSRNLLKSELQITLSETGTYSLQVSGVNSTEQSGKYSLKIANLEPLSVSTSDKKPTPKVELENKLQNLEEEFQRSERFTLLAQADEFYRNGNKTKAELIYRQVKEPFKAEQRPQIIRQITNPKQLIPEAQPLWIEAQAVWQETADLSPLQKFVQQYPAFIPGHLLLSQAYQKQEKLQHALKVLEQATSLFPDNYELIVAQVKALEADKKYLEASIAARQFTLIQPEHPQTSALTESADKNLKKFQGRLEGQMVRRGIVGTAVRVGGCLLIGACNPVGAIVGEGIKMGTLLVQGESGIGNQIAGMYKRELPIVQEGEVVDYVNELGNKIVQYMGRNDFDYEFYVVADEALNAFALPGGKVFVNTGAVLKTNSEAELAGLLAHEVSHAVLSHGFKQVITNNVYNNLGEIVNAALNNTVPLGNIIANLINLDYNRDQERQADLVGTRVLATSGYAADGLHNLMITLAEEKGSKGGSSFFSTHPATTERVAYIEELIQRNGYNRYAFEGVEKHAQVQKGIAKPDIQIGEKT
ncbi:M48 family metalloprotease [Lyngbya sp. PCC 8106]|uniref:M48 family metalloprotease n=1 Tax=Lyngbya sp. (strain PCC 8106) TaxID=313612 RepID=UPI0006817538|nr:M48 family metalloprotease [Lyngbya sp. PCC 8106]